MAATKKTSTKTKQVDELEIVALYMNYVLSHNELPKNTYLFCKDNAIEESDFYSFFGSLDHVREVIWLKFFENAVATILKEEAYKTYTDKNKLLTLFFTLFEILTLNRSYVLFALQHNDNDLKSLKDLFLMRRDFKNFVGDIIESNENHGITKLNRITKPVFSEGAWIQFLLILKYWVNDNSKGFEKTDIIIEKSVNTAVDLLDTKPIDSLIDLGKFLWKEGKTR